MTKYVRRRDHVCCGKNDDVTPDMICRMLPEILQKYQALSERYKKSIKARKRTLELSQPVFVKPKYEQCCQCRDGHQKRRLTTCVEEHVGTRTEQLAYPQVSKLMMLKNHESYDVFEPRRKHGVNLLISKSLHSMYSRLSNTQPPQPPPEPRKWSKHEWFVNKSYMTLLAKPKKPPPPVELIVKTRVLERLRRTQRLAKPKTTETPGQEEWHLTPKQKKYEPSERILSLARHKFRAKDDVNPYVIKREALKATASKRIQELAVASQRFTKKENLPPVFQTSRNAIKYKITSRTQELSAPRTAFDTGVAKDPYKVKRSALNFKITPRLQELAEPKRKRDKYVPKRTY